MKLTIIIPAYNEEKTIAEIIKKVDDLVLDKVEKEIIVVDDGSSDSTLAILKELEKNIKLKVFGHSRNSGKGSAIKTALKLATGECIVIQDADLECDPNDYKNLLSCMQENDALAVYGSRRIDPRNKKHIYMPYYFGGVFLTNLANFLYGIKITDLNTCYKLFKKEIFDKISLECRGFEFCAEITAKLAKKRIKIYETSISYNPRSREEGKKLRWKDGIKMVWVLIKNRLSK